MIAIWLVQRTRDARFPFRIAIEQDGRIRFAVRARAAWPGAGSQIFCLREREFDPVETLQEVERVPLAHLARLRRKLSVTLDRAQRKRCEFLILEKPRRDGAGTYEQVFRTEAAVRAHKTSKRAELSTRGGEPLHIVIDSMERYPWGFPGAEVLRRKLPVGDYALIHDERPHAIGLDARIRHAAMHELPDGFEIALLRKQFPGAKPVRLKRVVDQLRSEGRLAAAGHGRGTRWRRVLSAPPQSPG